MRLRLHFVLTNQEEEEDMSEYKSFELKFVSFLYITSMIGWKYIFRDKVIPIQPSSTRFLACLY